MFVAKLAFGGGKRPFLGSAIRVAVEALLPLRTCKLLRKRVSWINAIDRMLRAVTRLLLVAEIEQFECNLLDAVTLQIIKENTREPRRSSKSNNTHCLVFKLLYLCNQKEPRDHPQHPVYRIGYRNTFSEQFAHPGVSKASIVAMMSDPKNGRLPPPKVQFCYRHE